MRPLKTRQQVIDRLRDLEAKSVEYLEKGHFAKRQAVLAMAGAIAVAHLDMLIASQPPRSPAVSDLAELFYEQVERYRTADNRTAEHQDVRGLLVALVAANAPTILAGLAALEERDRLREAGPRMRELLARCQAHMQLAAVPGLRSLVPNPLVNEIAAALAQPTETTNSKEPPR